jgi:hypothetical protein
VYSYSLRLLGLICSSTNSNLTVVALVVLDKFWNVVVETVTLVLVKATGLFDPSVMRNTPFDKSNIVGSSPAVTTSKDKESPPEPMVGEFTPSALRIVCWIMADTCEPCCSTSATVWLFTRLSSNVCNSTEIDTIIVAVMVTYNKISTRVNPLFWLKLNKNDLLVDILIMYAILILSSEKRHWTTAPFRDRISHSLVYSLRIE